MGLLLLHVWQSLVVVDEDGSPQGRRTVALWNPPLIRPEDDTEGKNGVPGMWWCGSLVDVALLKYRILLI